MKKFILQRESDSERGPYQTNYRELLNDAQYEAVMYHFGPALLIAGAGSGKTRTLIFRLARLVEDGVPPESILLLTFTRRAAKEMLDRASGLLDDRCKRVRGGTFHHYCNHLLHRHASVLGYPQSFTLVDQADALDAIQLLRTDFVKEFRRQRFPSARTLQALFSTSINKMVPLYDIIATDYPRFVEHHDALADLQRRYVQYKREHGIMDFDDLLVNTIELLEHHDEIQYKIASQNRFVMVDEYQDSNRLQARLVKLFCSVHGNVMAVGDDAQSIYSFRGADFRNILEFPDLYPQCRLFKLEENFRSRRPILELSNRLLQKASEKFDKKLYTQKQGGDLPGLVKAPNLRDQSRFVVQMVLQLREQGIALGDVGVLFRNARDSYDLEFELNRSNIPFRKYGGQKFTEAAHLKDLLAHFRVVVNPDDAIAWNRVLQLVEGIGPKTSADLITWLRAGKNRFISDSELVSDTYKEQLKELGGLLALIKEFQSNPVQAVNRAIEYYAPLCEKKYDDAPKRLKDLQAFEGLIGGFSTLQQLLQELTLDPLDASATETLAGQKEESPLVLSTIHSAKGLEWDTVFIIQCLDGVIPSGYSQDKPEALDEELRLLYVASTRARERLFFTFPVTNESGHGAYFTNPSRFIDGIQEALLEPWMLAEASEQPALPPDASHKEQDGQH